MLRRNEDGNQQNEDLEGGSVRVGLSDVQVIYVRGHAGGRGGGLIRYLTACLGVSHGGRHGTPPLWSVGERLWENLDVRFGMS